MMGEKSAEPIWNETSLESVPTTRKMDSVTDRKSTRLNSSHANISYAVFCLKKKNTLHLSSPPFIHSSSSFHTPSSLSFLYLPHARTPLISPLLPSPPSLLPSPFCSSTFSIV